MKVSISDSFLSFNVKSGRCDRKCLPEPDAIVTYYRTFENETDGRDMIQYVVHCLVCERIIETLDYYLDCKCYGRPHRRDCDGILSRGKKKNASSLGEINFSGTYRVIVDVIFFFLIVSVVISAWEWLTGESFSSGFLTICDLFIHFVIYLLECLTTSA